MAYRLLDVAGHSGIERQDAIAARAVSPCLETPHHQIEKGLSMHTKKYLAARNAGGLLLCGLLLAPLAHADSAAPTLSSVLASSGIFAAGYISTGYTGSLNHGQTLSDRVFDSNANTFELNQAALILAHTPEQGFGGKVVMVGGSDAKVLNAFYGDGSSDLALFIAYAQYAYGPLTAIAGRFPALSGAELALEPLNTNISRSLMLALAQPVPLTGVRVNYQLSDSFTATVSLTNSDSFGSAAELDDNKQKAVEAGGAWTPSKAFKLALYNYYSKESDANGGKNDTVDLVASWQATQALQLVLNGDYKRAFDSTAAGPASLTYGAAGYLNYQFAPKWSSSLRLEALRLKNEDAGTATQVQEATLTGRYSATRDLRLLAEFRYDYASADHYADGTDPDTGAPILSKHATELGLTAIYTFGL
jgi:hypothetical protein